MAETARPRGYGVVRLGTGLTLAVLAAAPVVAFLWCDYAKWRELGNLSDEWRHPFLTALCLACPLAGFAALDLLLLRAIGRETPSMRTIALVRAFVCVPGVLGAALVALLAFVTGFASAGGGFMIDRKVDAGSANDVGIKVFFAIATPWLVLACLHGVGEALVFVGALIARGARSSA